MTTGTEITTEIETDAIASTRQRKNERNGGREGVNVSDTMGSMIAGLHETIPASCYPIMMQRMERVDYEKSLNVTGAGTATDRTPRALLEATGKPSGNAATERCGKSDVKLLV